jgi:hypothetical protein
VVVCGIWDGLVDGLLAKELEYWFPERCWKLLAAASRLWKVVPLRRAVL